MSAIGCKGIKKQNLERDFQRLRIPDDEVAITPDVFFMDLVVRRTDRLGLEVRRHPLILPHDWMSAAARWGFGRWGFNALMENRSFWGSGRPLGALEPSKQVGGFAPHLFGWS